MKCFNEHLHLLSGIGSELFVKNRWGCCWRTYCVSVWVMQQWTHRPPSRFWTIVNNSQRKRVVVTGKFSKWNFKKVLVRESSRLFLSTHTHPSFSHWHPQPEFSAGNHIHVYNVQESKWIRGILHCPHLWGKAPLLIFLLKSEQPGVLKLSKYWIKHASLQGKIAVSAICRTPIMFKSLTFILFSK